jgi:DNA-binding response OmpR family regulator
MGYFDLIVKPVNPIRLVARTKHAMRIIYGNSPPPG